MIADSLRTGGSTICEISNFLAVISRNMILGPGKEDMLVDTLYSMRNMLYGFKADSQSYLENYHTYSVSK